MVIAIAVIATIINHVCRRDNNRQVRPSVPQDQQQQLPSQNESLNVTVTTQDMREAEEAH